MPRFFDGMSLIGFDMLLHLFVKTRFIRKYDVYFIWKKIWKAFLYGLLVILIANHLKNHMPACEIYPSLYSINRWIFPLHYELYDESTGYFKNWILFLILIYR